MAKKTMIDGLLPPRRVAIVIVDGFSLGDLAAPVEMFGRARGRNDQPLYDVRVCSVGGRVSTSHLQFVTQYRLASLRSATTIVVPGTNALPPTVSPEVLRALRRAADRGVRVASICTGAFVLAAAGLLDGRRATTHWRATDALARQYPTVDVDPDVLYVDDGQICTSAGAAAGLDLCLHLIRRDFGKRTAAAVAREAVMPLERAGGQAQFIAHEVPPQTAEALEPVLRWIERHAADPISVEHIARHAATSVRTLNRQFKRELHTTPARWLTKARVHRAQRLLVETSASIEEVAASSGFGSAVTLRDCFRRLVGTSPRAYRQSFG